MSVLQQHPLPPMSNEEVCTLLATDQLTEQHVHVLRWLVWLSLLAREELARVFGRDEKTLWGHLDHLVKRGLVDYVILNETGWPRRHHRYHITDLGLYALAARHAPTLSARKIAMSYPVTRADLLERLARPQVHFLLCELITRLISECPTGYRLSSYQQPYKQTYRDLTRKHHTITFDAAFLLQKPDGTQHAFYLHVDQPEHLFSQKEVKSFIQKLLVLRQWMHLQREVMPHLLLLSGVERLSFWSEHLEHLSLKQGISLLNGSIAAGAAEQMQKGAYAPIWIPFRKLPEHDGRVQKSDPTDLLSLLDQPASLRLVEHFSQYFTFQETLRLKEGGRSSKNQPLKRYVGGVLRQEAAPLVALLTPRDTSPEERAQRPVHTHISGELMDAFYDNREERLKVSTQLTLALSNQQKDILTYLTRHPYLSVLDLLMLLHPQSRDERLLARQITPLIHLGLVAIYPWIEATSWRTQERYYPSEAMLRFAAMRHGLSPASYLYPLFPKEEKRHAISPLSREVTWLQRGAPLLRQQMAHTNGLYHCVRTILAASYRGTPYRIHYWKSAQESVRWYRDPFSDKIVCIRPDAELLYTAGDLYTPRPLLLEYERGYTYSRERERKFRCYADYQHVTRTTLPPTLVITRDERGATAIQKTIAHEKAFDVQVIMLLESQVIQEGLLPILDHILGS